MKILKTLTLIVTIAFFTACNSDDDTVAQLVQDVLNLETDRNALIEIYNANTNSTLTWDIATTDVSNWDGVVVENNRVAVLSIGDADIEILPATAMQKLTALRNLTARDNSIVTLNLSKNVNLKNLQLFNNQITAIDVSNNILLEQLLVENNDLELLDVSMLSNLTDLKAGSNSFNGSVNIANGNNVNMWRMHIGSNHDLICVQVDAGATNGYAGWTLADYASYSTNCQ